MPCEDNNDQLRDDLQQTVQALINLGADNLQGFPPGMLDGITCSSNLAENIIGKKLLEAIGKYIDFPAHNIPTYCVTTMHLGYNFNLTDPKKYKQGFLNFERFPCRKTCGFCGGMFFSLTDKK